MEQAAVRIALRKIDPGGKGSVAAGPRLGTGGGYSGFFLWDTAFTVLWAKYHRAELPVEGSLDNLYRHQDEEGFIAREFTADGSRVFPKHHPVSFAPPVLAWAELDLYALTGNQDRLRRVYPALSRHHRYCAEHFREKDGLFIGDPWGSGMDNLPRWPRDYRGSEEGQVVREEELHPSVVPWFRRRMHKSVGSTWNRQGRYLDMSAQMAFDADCLKQIATLLGVPEEARTFSRERDEISDAINERCWSAEHQFYFDLGYGRQIPRFHVGAYWALIAGIVPRDRVDGLIAHLENRERFNRRVPVPTLSADDPDYRAEGGYWLGASWPPTTYMVLRGLRAVGAEDLARTLADRYVQAVRTVFEDTGTFWENLAPDARVPGNPGEGDFCGWAGLGPVAIVREFTGRTPRPRAPAES